jgi:uncharacterized surface protein with fasciclin (FAS1) repeats
MKTYIFSLTTVLFFFIGTTIQSQNIYADDSDRVVTKVLGTDTIYSNLSLAENLSKIPAFSRQLQVFKFAEFEKMIGDYQMVTVFVVKNNAFDFMDEEELEDFLSTSNKNKLAEMQSHYIIPGRVDEHAIKRAITDGGGAASFRTINNKNIRFTAEGESIYLYTDAGSKSKLLETNLYHNKGFFHVTASIPMKKL